MDRPVITLLTDFGTDDTYVGQMKGAIAGICPRAVVIDLTHAVPPQAIEQGAFLLETALDVFPAGTVHVAVVDPGVGTERAGLAIHAGGRYFVGPDNGLLSCAVASALRPPEAARIAPPDGVVAVRLVHPTGRAVSPVFHGRDIFADAAARLACAGGVEAYGERVDSMLVLPAFRAIDRTDAGLDARVIHIDRFGNIVTSAHRSQLEDPPRDVRLGTVRVTRFVSTYGDGSGLVALIGSSGYLEVAEVNGNAAMRLDVKIGDSARIDRAGTR